MLTALRIAHVAPVVYPVPPSQYGGTERVIADLAGEQYRTNEVTVFGPTDCRVEGVQQIGTYQSLSARYPTVADAPPGLAAELEAQQLRDLVIHGSNFDIIHLHGSAHASGVCAALGVPTVRTIHWRADEPDHVEHFRAFSCERVIAISENQARSVPRGNLAGVVHHGMPLDRYELGTGAGDYLAFLGRMSDQKRPDRAIKLAQQSRLPLRLAGPIDPGNPRYFKKHVEPALGDHIEYVGSVTDSEKEDFLGNAKALVFPIDWPEPFGLVMIEAMACGTPVIAWGNGSVPEIVEHGRTGFVVQTIEDAVCAVEMIGELDRISIRQSFEERFSSHRMAEETQQIYYRVINQRS